MRYEQPPITSEAEYHGYQAGLDKMTKMVEVRETRLFDALQSGDTKRIEDRRSELLHMLRLRQGIIDAIHVYEKQQQKQSA